MSPSSSCDSPVLKSTEVGISSRPRSSWNLMRTWFLGTSIGKDGRMPLGIVSVMLAYLASRTTTQSWKMGARFHGGRQRPSESGSTGPKSSWEPSTGLNSRAR